MRRSRLVCLVSLAAVSILAGSEQGRPDGASAQSQRLGYELVERWQLEAQPAAGRGLGWPAGHRPGGIGVDAATGRIYATDRQAGSIRIYDPILGFQGLQPLAGEIGGLSQPRDVAVLPGSPKRLAISDSARDRVLIVEEDGSLVAAIDLPSPAGIVPSLAHDPDDAAFYVLSTDRQRIYGYDADGGPLVSFALDGSVAPEGLAHPEVNAIVAPGRDYRRFLIADPGAGEVRDIVIQGGGIRSSERIALAGATAAAGGLAVTPGPGASLQVQRFGGAPDIGLARLDQLDPSQGARPFAQVWDLEMTIAGRLYALVEPQGLVDLGDAGLLALESVYPNGGLISPERLAAGGGELLLGDASPYLQRVSLDGRPAGRLYELGGSLPPVDVAAHGERRYYLSGSELVGGRSVRSLDAAGGIEATWQAERDNEHRIEAIAADREHVAVLDLLGQELRLLDAELSERARWSLSAGAFKGLLDVAIGGQRVFLANQQSGDLEIWRLDGSRVGAVEIPTGPLRLTAREDGVALVLTGADWVFAYGPDGEPLGAWPAGQPQDRPIDLDLGDDGRLYVLDAGGEIRVYQPEADPEVLLPPPSSPERCAVVRDKGAAPQEILLGETVDVSLVVEGTCPLELQTADVVLAIDTSGSMNQETKMSAARNAAIAFLAQTDPLLTRVGLVRFAGEPQVVLELTDDRRRAIAAVNGLQPEGGTRLVPPLEASIDLVTGEGSRAGAGKVIVFMSDGRDTDGGSQHNPDPAGLVPALERARQAGVTLFTIGLGSDVDERTLRRMAEVGGAYYHSPSGAELRDVYLQIARRIEAVRLFERITVVDEVPANMTYLPGTGRPFEPEVAPDGKTLRWHFEEVYEPGIEMGYRLRPEEAGLWPTNERAWADFVDGFGHADQSLFPVPRVRVLLPTPTPVHSPTPGPSPTPTVTFTPSPTPEAVYLPMLLREHCQDHRLHLVLALDVSSSMGAPIAPGGEAKIEAARAAALRFTEQLDLQRDRLSILAFDENARILASGHDRARLEDTLRGLEIGRGTRIDRALARARGELTGDARLRGSRAVVILLSDGAPTPGTEDDARAEAAALRAAGAELHSVAVGQDAARALLAELAGDPARAWFADDGGSLLAIYARLAEGLAACRPSWLAP